MEQTLWNNNVQRLEIVGAIAEKKRIRLELGFKVAALVESKAAKAGLTISEYIERVLMQNPEATTAKRNVLNQDLIIEVGEVLSARRRALGYSQSALAERADIHRTYISDVERGGRNLSLRALFQLSRALHISVGTVLETAEANLKS